MIGLKIIGAESVIARFEGAPARLRMALIDTTLRLAYQAQRQVMDTKLSGQVLHVRSGRLRRSINVQSLTEGARVGASTGTNVVYGRFWELGFDGTENVSAHTRQLGSRNVYDVTRLPSGRLRRVQAGSGVAFVRAHPRRVNVSPRPFLSVVLEEMRAQARQDMTAAARGAI